MNLRYERLSEQHFPLLEKHLFRDNEVMKFLYDYETGMKKLPYYVKHWDDHGFGWYSIFVGDEFAGRVGLFWNNSSPPEVEIGYTLRRAFWKKGIAEEACTFLLDEFRQLQISNIVVARIELENTASVYLAKKLGFKERNSKPVMIEGNPNSLYEYTLNWEHELK